MASIASRFLASAAIVGAGLVGSSAAHAEQRTTQLKTGYFNQELILYRDGSKVFDSVGTLTLGQAKAIADRFIKTGEIPMEEQHALLTGDRTCHLGDRTAAVVHDGPALVPTTTVEFYNGNQLLGTVIEGTYRQAKDFCNTGVLPPNLSRL